MAMTLRTDEELDRALNRLAENKHLSKQEVVRRAVLMWDEADARRTRIGEIAAGVMDEYADALHRLGSV